MMNYQDELKNAISFFWKTRTRQGDAQGQLTGIKDAGNRALVTGGKQLDGFITLFEKIIEDEGIPSRYLHVRQTTLPGYYRPTKEWDFVVVIDGTLVATIEFKSHVGPSFGNNFNNRVEEALGNATDINTAYREGVFSPSSKPWIGYLMLLEDHPKSTAPVRASEPHFQVSREFKNASYERRYELFCTRLIRERLYDASCLLLSSKDEGLKGGYREPNIEISFTQFVTSLQGRLKTILNQFDI
jgi:hypothetical protein